MKSTPRGLRVALLSCGVIAVVMGCSGPTSYPRESGGARSASPSSGTDTVGREQVEGLRGEVQRLRSASHEALAAAIAIGVAEATLADARTVLATAEQQLRDGEVAYAAKQYEQGWEKLVTARGDLSRVEEAVVRAGLAHIERALTDEYGSLPARKLQLERSIGLAGQVTQGIVNLREGAGTNFQVVGKARVGEILGILDETPAWYRVRTPEGQQGWVFKGLITRLPGREAR